MSSPFDPRRLLDIAEHLLDEKPQPESARKRSIANRSYYGVYGYLVLRICEEQNRPRSDLFEGQGHHTELASLLRHPALKPAKAGLNALRKKREKADYDYYADFTREDAESMIDTAHDAVSALDSAHSDLFRRMTLPWLGRPRR